ncbi:uncharacterized protein ATC70_008058 [Mucor velutinosus]|uniref:Uncharacterized protein n=1 Tax=Mucor velutinosus TaxID=708070 RepID=A0AAN7D6P8_9FUNG|nr:hypothetical protein ATC70_008058 [Mucor velutinosus]
MTMDTDTPATLMSQMDLQRLVLTMQQDISAHNSALQELNALKTTILNLQKQNESLTQENERLRQQLNSQQGSTTTQAQPKSGIQQQPKPHSSATQSTQQAPNATKKTPNNSWTEVIKRSKKVRNPADVTDKHRQAITRGFNLAPEGPKGYTTVYFNRSRRFTRTEVRNNLHLIKADASRIIDDNLVSILTKNNINVVEGFDPTDPKHLADPKFKEMSLSKREDAAFDLQINRCAKSLVYLANRRSRLFCFCC